MSEESQKESIADALKVINSELRANKHQERIHPGQEGVEKSKDLEEALFETTKGVLSAMERPSQIFIEDWEKIGKEETDPKSRFNRRADLAGPILDSAPQSMQGNIVEGLRKVFPDKELPDPDRDKPEYAITSTLITTANNLLKDNDPSGLKQEEMVRKLVTITSENIQDDKEKQSYLNGVRQKNFWVPTPLTAGSRLRKINTYANDAAFHINKLPEDKQQEVIATITKAMENVIDPSKTTQAEYDAALKSIQDKMANGTLDAQEMSVLKSGEKSVYAIIAGYHDKLYDSVPKFGYSSLSRHDLQDRYAAIEARAESIDRKIRSKPPVFADGELTALTKELLDDIQKLDEDKKPMALHQNGIQNGINETKIATALQELKGNQRPTLLIESEASLPAGKAYIGAAAINPGLKVTSLT